MASRGKKTGWFRQGVSAGCLPLMSPHPSSQLRMGSGCTAVKRHQGAQERHGCRKRLSTEAALRRNALPVCGGPTAELRTTWLWGLQPLQSSRTAMQTYLVALDTYCPHPILGNGAPVCVREHVSPSQICYRFRARPLLERPLNFSLYLCLLHWKERRDLRVPGLHRGPIPPLRWTRPLGSGWAAEVQVMGRE